MAEHISASNSEVAESLAGFARYLSVSVAARQFAIPLDRVIGVVESTKITPLPFSPPPFEGLVLAMGHVVPQISLATLLRLPPSEGGVVVLVSDIGGSIGLRVDAVHAMLQVERDQVVLSSSETRAAEPMVMGRFGEGAASCGVLDLDHLTGPDLVATAAQNGAVLMATETTTFTADDDITTERQLEPYLMVSVSGEVYAVKVDHLVEVLELSTLRTVPHAPQWTAGMIDLRGEPILGLSLAELLRRPEKQSGQLGLMIAVPAGRVALIAEHSLGIERYGSEDVHPLREPIAGIESYLVKSDDSVVAIIDPETLLRPISDELPAWVPQASTVDPAAQPPGGTGFHQYLTLRVGREMLAVPLERIHRLQASVQLSPIPQNGTGFDGMADVGDGVVPVIDLRRTLAGEQDPAGGDVLSPCLLAVIEGGMAGIIVNQVLRIESVPEDQIMPAEDSPALPVSQILHLHGQLMSVLALDRLLPPL